MLRIRTTKTSSGSIAVQVVEYYQRKREILAHIGSARNNQELLLLKQDATNWIADNDKQPSLFTDLLIKKKGVVDWNNYVSGGFRYKLLYDVLNNIVILFGFNLNQMLTDLVIARIVSPGSKLQSLQFLEEAFDINYSYRALFRALPSLINLKDDIESKAITIAKKHFNFNFSLVFYDLTTLYFESFETDELRRIGFSKDNKGSQPQIMIGLLVNDLGFPISHQIFPGNKFEGHSLMPSILALKKRHKIEKMTVVADSAMISDNNIKFLRAENLNYIVAARTANLGLEIIETISKQLDGKDDATIRITTEKGNLICHFSNDRYGKEKREMEKQLEKAKAILSTPSKVEIIKRTKFLKGKKLGYELNCDLINKTTLLLGIKGYYSNCNLTDLEIVKQYKNLWQVEKAFRISKSDLRTRPIYHFKESMIKIHILICFMALAIAKYIEIKTNQSVKSVTHLLKTATDTIIINKTNGEKIILKPDISEEIKGVVKNMEITH